MDENNKKLTADTSMDDKIKELFDLMDAKAAAGELIEVEDEPAPAAAGEQPEEKYTPMSPNEVAAYEYSMMMAQYEAMAAEYRRLDAEEKAAKAAEKAAAEAKAAEGKGE